MTACSATLMLLHQVTSATVISPSDRRVQVHMVGTDAGGDGQAQLRGLGDPLRGQVPRPERLRDDDVGVRQLPLEHRVGAILVAK